MRSILLAAVLAASSLVTHVQTADACGGSYEWQPVVHTVATPAVSEAKQQSFALLYDRLDAKRAKTVKLTQIDRMSFDTAKTAPGRRLDDPARLTLLGPSGTKTVEIFTTTWVDLAFDHEEARESVALPKGEWMIALDGIYKDARWESFNVIHGDSVTTFNGTYVQAVLNHGQTSFTINGTTLEGYPLGMVTVKNTRFVAVRSATAVNDTFLVRI
jgi:hypothetical protein